jgi:effector-binding domain-containing protein
MNNKLSIGDISKLFNISIKTLRYYDKIELFKPIEVNKDNGYRYYSIEQFEQLNTINYLKFLGIPLKDIKNYLEVRNLDHFIDILECQKDIYMKKIEQLKIIINRFDNQIKEIEESKKIKTEQVIIKQIEKRKIISLNEKIKCNSELEISLRKLENIANISSSIMIGRVGLTIDINNIKKGVFNNYNSIFILLEEDLNNSYVKTLPKSQYACIYYNGCDHKESSIHYKSILSFLEKNNYQITGDAIERVIINQYKSNNKDDYLTEIQIPVRK